MPAALVDPLVKLKITDLQHASNLRVGTELKIAEGETAIVSGVGVLLQLKVLYRRQLF
jgi:hypothetical protein